MNLVAVKSSRMLAVGYDAEAKTLRVLFPGGELYDYFDVDSELHAALMKSASKGSFFQEHVVESQIEYQKVTSGKEGNYDGKEQATDRSRSTRKEVRHGSTSSGSNGSSRGRTA